MTISLPIQPDAADPLTGPFWAAARESRLVVQKCRGCGYLRWPPAAICPECLDPVASWEQVSAAGSLYSFATYHRSFDRSLAADIPYTVGLVELDAGPRMYGRVLAEPEALTVGGRVAAVFVPAAPEITVIAWRLEDAK
jgi:uncharacterized protein